jgi:hypothetical protein
VGVKSFAKTRTPPESEVAGGVSGTLIWWVYGGLCYEGSASANAGVRLRFLTQRRARRVPGRVAAMSAGDLDGFSPDIREPRPASRSSRRLDWTPRNSHDVDGVDDHVAGDGARLWGLGAYSLPLCASWRQAHNKPRPKARGALCRSFLYSGKQPLTLKQLIF